MGDIGPAAACFQVTGQRDQAVLGQRCQRRFERGRIVAGTKLGDGLLTTGVGPALAELDHPDEDAPCDLDLPGILDLEPVQDAVGMAGYGHFQTVEMVSLDCPVVCLPRQDQRLVGVQRQDPPFELFPELDQGFLDQGQDPQRVGLDRIGGQPLDEVRLDVYADRVGRAVDHLAQPGLVERPDVQAIRLDPLPEGRAHQLGVEIGPDRQDHVQRVDLEKPLEFLEERSDALLRGCEDLLELVHDQEQPLRLRVDFQRVGHGGGWIGWVGAEDLGQLGQRPLTGPHGQN